MTIIVYKYTVEEAVDRGLDIPTGSRLLCVQVDERAHEPSIWVQINGDAHVGEIEHWKFQLVLTGINPTAEADYDYLGTYQHHWFVGHVFYKKLGAFDLLKEKLRGIDV